MGKVLSADPGVELQVDPQVLRALAGQLDSVASVIKFADVGTKATTAADGLPGSTTQWAAHSVGAHFTQMTTKLAEHVTEMGQACLPAVHQHHQRARSTAAR